MKRLTAKAALIYALALFLTGLVLPQTAAAQNNFMPGTVNLDTALGDFSSYVVGKLPAGTVTAVDVMDTPIDRLGNYIADRLTDLLINNAGLRIISRQDFEKVLVDQNVQTSLNFDDDTTAKIGHIMGWQFIIFGVVEPMQNSYHLSLRAVEVETGIILGSKSYSLTGSDPVLVNIVNPAMSIQKLNERDSILTPFDGEQNDFSLRVSTNKTVYYDQEFLFVTLRSNINCYFVVFHLDANNNMQIIFPNRLEKNNNSLSAGVDRVIPENSYFLLQEPFGEERILVYASEQPINISDNQYRSRSLTEEYLSDPQAIWRGGGSTVTPSNRSKSASGQATYILLPGHARFSE